MVSRPAPIRGNFNRGNEHTIEFWEIHFWTILNVLFSWEIGQKLPGLAGEGGDRSLAEVDDPAETHMGYPRSQWIIIFFRIQMTSLDKFGVYPIL
jgi:hypothetical protein